MSDLKKELANVQEKMRAIHKLSNCIPKIESPVLKNEIAYLIHRIIEADYFSSELAREVQAFQIESNKDIFMSVSIK